MEVLSLLLPLSVILILSKLLCMGCKRINLPQVVGMLLAGIIVGCANYLPDSSFKTAFVGDDAIWGIKVLAEIGVVLIMFEAGLGTNLKTVKSCGVASMVVTVLGVVVPMGLGFLVAGLSQGFTGTTEIAGLSVKTIYSDLFYGVILTATSVSVTVATLKEMGRLNGKAGTIILSAAILDDIVGIVVLSIILSIAGGGSSARTFGSILFNNDIIAVITDVISFFVFTIILCLVAHKVFKMLNVKMSHTRRVPIFALAFAFFMAWSSEKFFGVADITGAFFAGLSLSGLGHHINPQRDELSNDTTDYIERKSDVLSYMLFTPVFFAKVGLTTDFSAIEVSMIGFGILFILAGLFGKVIGCGVGGLATKHSVKDSIRIGVGMMARAEVCLICAQKGVDAGLVDVGMVPFIVVMIVFSSFITPVILKITYKGEAPVKLDYVEETFTSTHDNSASKQQEEENVVFTDENMEP